MISFRSVKFRLTVWYAVILTILLSVFAFLMHAELARVLYRDVDHNLALEARRLEEGLQIDLEPVFEKALLPEVKRPAGPYDISSGRHRVVAQQLANWEKKSRSVERSALLVRIIGLNRRSVLSNLTGWQREIIFPDFERDSLFTETGKSFQTIHFRAKSIRLYYSLVRVRGRPFFIIQCGISTQEVKNTLERLAFLIWLSIPGTVGAACIAGWFLAKRSLSPIDHMIREARQITAAYLKGRLPRTHTLDELDRLAETLNEMLDRLESSTKAIQDFSSDISHELKTPLAIIRGEIDLALRRSRSPEAVLETLRVIESEVDELIRLVDDLLLLVRSDAKQLRFEKKEVSLGGILKQVVERYKERALAKKIDLTLRLDQDAPIQGDETYLKRLFSNLLDNAIKFTPEGGRVGVKLRATDQETVVEVFDTGMGIELEMQPKVFSRFYRTDQARSHEGAGLGLNIAKAIAEAHTGLISIQSQPQKGTIVTVRFLLSTLF